MDEKTLFPPACRGAVLHDWPSPSDTLNPLNWSLAVKIYHAWIIFGFSFLAVFNSTLFITTYPVIEAEFGVDYVTSIVPYTTYVAGLVPGLLLAGPFSEAFGRRKAYLLIVPLSGFFLIGTALAQNFATLVVCRFFAGLFAAPAISVGGGLVADMFKPQDRMLVMTLIVVGPFLGPSLALAFGGYLIEAKGWTWASWLSAILLLIMTVSALGMRETYKKLILDRESTKCAICREDFVEVVTPSYGKVLIAHGLRPLKMLFTEPLVAVLSLYIGFAFGVIYGCFTAVPYIFTTQYGFSAQQDGLVFLGMSAGYVIATIGVIILALRKRRAIVKMIAAKQRPTVPAPEAQLLLAQVGSPLIVVSLFMLGWTAHARVHWIVPVIALGIYACGFILVFLSISLYLNVAYGAQYGASASSANRMAAYAFGVGFPLFTRQMFEKLGIGWAASLLGFIAAAMTPLPWILERYGPTIRAKSKMAVSPTTT